MKHFISVALLTVGLTSAAWAAQAPSPTITSLGTIPVGSSVFNDVVVNPNATEYREYTFGISGGPAAVLTFSFSEWVSGQGGSAYPKITLVTFQAGSGASTTLYSGSGLSDPQILTLSGTFATAADPYYKVWVTASDAVSSGNSKFSVAVSPVPEPAEWAMMLIGIGAVAIVARRRKGLGSIAGD